MFRMIHAKQQDVDLILRKVHSSCFHVMFSRDSRKSNGNIFYFHLSYRLAVLDRIYLNESCILNE